jgi:hypothetical protein
MLWGKMTWRRSRRRGERRVCGRRIWETKWGVVVPCLSEILGTARSQVLSLLDLLLPPL